MSFYEYRGGTKVSASVTRILRNAQENLPRIQQGTTVATFLKSFSQGVGNKSGPGCERLNSNSHQTCKFGLQRLRLGMDKKKGTGGSNHRAELLDNNEDAEGEHESGDEEDEEDARDNNKVPNDAGRAFLQLTSADSSLIQPSRSPNQQKQKRWRF